MILVNRLELQGFKSFANRTVLEFKPGMMAIVGPNGCGKTNLVDAIRWVMGEQRTSLLRAEKMEAIIFNGTAHRKPLGFAEVTITFYNPEGFASLPYSEIAITRRLFRTGESEYLINRQPTRLRDVQSILAEMGLGRHSSSIIELAMVEGILYGPREGRRALLEDVAGIAHYHNRIAEAKKSLDNSRSQLQRLDDLLDEIEKNYHTLKRQASRAEKAQQLQSILNDRLLYDLGQTRLEIAAQIGEAHRQIYSLTENKNTLEKLIEALSEEERRQESQIYERERRWEECLRELSRWERSRSDLERELALSQQRADHLHSQKQEKEAKLFQAVHQLNSAQANYQSLSEEINHLNQSLSHHLSQLREMESIYQHKEQELTTIRNASESNRWKLHQFRQRIENRRSEALRRKVQEERLVAQWESAQSQLKELRSRRDHYEEIEGQLNKRREELKGLLTQKEREVISEETHLRSLKEELRNLSKQLGIAAVKGEEAQARLDFHLASALSNLPSSLVKEAKMKGWSALKTLIDIPEDLRKPVLAVLGSWLEGIVISDLPQDLIRLKELIPHQKLVLIDPSLCSADKFLNAQVDIPVEGAYWLSDRLSQNGKSVHPLLISLCRWVLLLPDEEAFHRSLRWAEEHRVTLVTPDGILFRPPGIVETGGEENRITAAQWKRTKEALEAEIAKWKENEAELREQAQELEVRIKESEQAVEGKRVEFSRLSAQLRELEIELTLTTKRKREEAKEIETWEALIGTLEHQRRQLTSPTNKPQDFLTDLFLGEEDAKQEESQIVALEASIREEEKIVHSLERELAAIQKERDRIQWETAEIKENLATLKAQHRHWSERIKELENERQSLTLECENINRELANSQEAIQTLKTQLEMILQDHLNLKSRHQELENQKSALEKEKEKTSQELHHTRQNLKRLTEELTRWERAEASLSERLKEIDRRLVEELGVLPGVISEESLKEVNSRLQATPWGNLTTEELRSRLGSLGPINMMALEELKPVEERYRFLCEQQKDLREAITLLEETIDRTSRQARQRFRNTFEQVNHNFQELFQVLFEGGEARLVMEGDDPLTADIRIYATPSGKRLQSLAALSGGEKALTAIAFLFALYKCRPTPFAILDEIDAPLDDINVTRFTKLLQQFSDRTQFLIVTHNKKTMEAADCLYGVSLSDDGSSQLVSVKLNHNPPRPVSERALSR